MMYAFIYSKIQEIILKMFVIRNDWDKMLNKSP